MSSRSQYSPSKGLDIAFRRRLVKQSGELFLKLGIRSVTMDDIAQNLGISKKTLYQYVENKKELVEQVISDHIEKEKRVICKVEQQGGNAIDQLMGIADYIKEILPTVSNSTIYDLNKYYPDLLKKFNDFSMDYIYDCIKRNLLLGIQEGLYRKNQNVEILSRFYVVQAMSILDNKIFPHETISLNEIFDTHLKYFIFGIGTPIGINQFEKLIQKKGI